MLLYTLYNLHTQRRATPIKNALPFTPYQTAPPSSRALMGLAHDMRKRTEDAIIYAFVTGDTVDPTQVDAAWHTLDASHALLRPLAPSNFTAQIPLSGRASQNSTSLFVLHISLWHCIVVISNLQQLLQLRRITIQQLFQLGVPVRRQAPNHTNPVI